jgi:hypothetical protein
MTDHMDISSINTVHIMLAPLRSLVLDVTMHLRTAAPLTTAYSHCKDDCNQALACSMYSTISKNAGSAADAAGRLQSSLEMQELLSIICIVLNLRKATHKQC